MGTPGCERGGKKSRQSSALRSRAAGERRRIPLALPRRSEGSREGFPANAAAVAASPLFMAVPPGPPRRDARRAAACRRPWAAASAHGASARGEAARRGGGGEPGAGSPGGGRPPSRPLLPRRSRRCPPRREGRGTPRRREPRPCPAPPGLCFPEAAPRENWIRGWRCTRVSSARGALCRGSGAVLSTVLLGRTFASVQNCHSFVLGLLNVQERVRGEAPVLDAVTARYKRLLRAALTVSEADLKHKGQILPSISPEQQKWGCEGFILSSTVITVWSSEERAEQIATLACWMAHRSTVHTVYCFLSNRDAMDILQPK